MSLQRWVFFEALKRSDISKEARAVGVYIAFWMNDRTGEAFPSFDTVAQLFPIGWPKFKSGIEQLEAAGLIRVERRRGRGGNRYWCAVTEADDGSGDIVLRGGHRLTMSRTSDIPPSQRSRARDIRPAGMSRTRDVPTGNVAETPPECRGAAIEHLNTISSSSGQVPTEEEEFEQQVLQELGERDLRRRQATGPAVNHPHRWLPEAIRRREPDRAQALALHREHPDWTVEVVADAIDGSTDTPSPRTPCGECGALTKCRHRRVEQQT